MSPLTLSRIILASSLMSRINAPKIYPKLIRIRISSPCKQTSPTLSINFTVKAQGLKNLKIPRQDLMWSFLHLASSSTSSPTNPRFFPKSKMVQILISKEEVFKSSQQCLNSRSYQKLTRKHRSLNQNKLIKIWKCFLKRSIAWTNSTITYWCKINSSRK